MLHHHDGWVVFCIEFREEVVVLARIRKRGFLVERRAGFAAVELGRGA
jgi:hypothetical protein